MSLQIAGPATLCVPGLGYRRAPYMSNNKNDLEKKHPTMFTRSFFTGAGPVLTAGILVHRKSEVALSDSGAQKPRQRGALYLTAGPSGAGKDTLLLAARDELSSAAGAVSGGSQQQIEFLKRVITRDPSKCTDLEIPVTLEEFKQVCGRSVGRSVGWRKEATDIQ